jgi:hypothetical protein
MVMSRWLTIRFSRLFVVSLLLLSIVTHTAKADANEKKTGVYLCTRDLYYDKLWSLSSSTSDSKQTKKNTVCKLPEDIYDNLEEDAIFVPYKGLDNKCHAKLRHCFMVKARYDGDLHGDIDGFPVFNLEYDSSLGFGRNEEKQATTYVETIFLGKEAIYKKLPVSCELIFSEEDLTDDDINYYNGSVNRAMNHKWADVLSFMEEEKTEGYGATSHNCCTVALKVVEDIGSNRIDEIKEALSSVNYGIGTKFVGVFGASSAFLSSSGTSSESSQEVEDTNLDQEERVVEAVFDSLPGPTSIRDERTYTDEL